MSTEKIFLGTLRNGSPCFGGEKIWLTKHQWECGWYWGFGYVGNSKCHFHFDCFLEKSLTAAELFSDAKIADKDWWVIRDLFKQAYALKRAAEVYLHGGHQTHLEGVTDILRNNTMASLLNNDLEKVLNTAWDFIKKTTSGK